MATQKQTAMSEREYVQGVEAGELIQFMLRRKDAYYEAPVNRRWWDATQAIEAALDQRFTPEEEDLTRAKYYLATMLSGSDALEETYTDGYTSADPLFVFNNKRRGKSDLAEKAQWLMANVWEEGEGLDTWLSLMRDINRYGMGVGYARWERREGQGLAVENKQHPWGTLATIALQKSTLMNRAVIERIPPGDWWGYWLTAENLPWEGVTRDWGACELSELLDDDEYDDAGINAAIERLEQAAQARDSEFASDIGEPSEIPDHNTMPVYEYWGTLYGAKGFEKDRREYQVIFTDREILLRPRLNAIPNFRPIKRARGIIVNDWCGGRPALLPQLPATKIENFMVNSSIDDLTDRLYTGWAAWEDSLTDPDEFLNPEGVGGVVRMKKGAGQAEIPQRIGQGQSGIQADIERFYKNILEADRQTNSFADVLSQKSGLLDGTARAANIVASQGARKVKAIMTNANTTGLLPLAEAMLLLTILNNSPEDMATQTRDGREFALSPEDFSAFLQRNLWTYSDSFRRDPFMDAQAMDRLAKVGGVEFLTQHATDPRIPLQFWRSYARYNRIPNYDEFFPDMPPTPKGQAPAPAGPPGMSVGGPGQSAAPPEMQMQEQTAEQPEAAAVAA